MSTQASDSDLRLRFSTLHELSECWSGLDLEAAPSPDPIAHLRREVVDGEEIFVYGSAGPTHRLVVLYRLADRCLEIGWWEAERTGLEGLDDIFTSYLLGNLIAIALRLSGQIVLHGNAVLVGDRAIAWVGGKGAGKSTLSAAFADAGYEPITDDQLVLRVGPEGYLPAHGVPAIRLWSHSLETMNATTLASFNQPFGNAIKGWLEFAIPGDQGHPAQSPPLAALYVLEPRGAALSTPRSSRLSPGERLLRLLHHRLARVGLTLTHARQQTELAALARLASSVPILSLQLPDALEALPSAVRQLAAGIESLDQSRL